jgi:hypothetical protein
MHGTTTQRKWQPYAGGVSYASQPYWGWSHRNQRMEFMDLPTYMDAIQQGYDIAFGDLAARMQQLGSPAAGIPGAAPSAFQLTGAPGTGPVKGGHGFHREHGPHEHAHCDCGTRWHEHHDCEERDCGCGRTRDRDGGFHRHDECDDCKHDHRRGHGRCRGHDCRCDCCIVDADIVVFAHCGEVRVVPIEVENDSRKIRENVEVQVSEVRSGGGKVLAWPTAIQPKGPLTLDPCSTTRLELMVQIACQSEPANANPARSGGTRNTSSDPFATLAAQREQGSDVDRCEVGYATIRLGGCLVRPIVVAIAALPLGCDNYRVGCSCSCCC